MAEDSPQSKGGNERARKLSPGERRAIAKTAASARWAAARAAINSDLPRATHAGERQVGGFLIPVYNLDDGRRVLSERGFLAVIGAKGRGTGNGHRVAQILADTVLKSFFKKKVLMAIAEPVRFLTPANLPALGYGSDILSDFCIAFAKAKSARALRTDVQQRYAEHCEALLYAFAEVGIEAWIDEATGFQNERARDALHKILERYLAKHWAQWAKTFPDEYYQQVFRLRGWRYDPSSLSRPGVLGHITNDVVYSRLAPGVLDALREKNPVVNDRGDRARKHHQWLTRDHGHPKLKEHIGNLMFLMKSATKWDSFYRALQRAAPRLHETPEFDFGDY